MKKVLENKNAVIYGGGSIAVARGLAREGARVFLAGRTRDLLEMVANGSPMMAAQVPPTRRPIPS
jgi:NAD(P)-dependent dehydrogenase (short-subunit alcohol dehydrogenase family)